MSLVINICFPVLLIELKIFLLIFFSSTKKSFSHYFVLRFPPKVNSIDCSDTSEIVMRNNFVIIITTNLCEI